MIFLDFYKEKLGLKTEEDVFEYILSNLKKSNVLWTYFVNWKKVFKNTKEIELSLNTMNYLIGKENFDDELRFVLRKDNSLAGIIPFLIVRDGSSKKKFEILVDYSSKKLIYDEFDFTKKHLSDEDIEKCVEFISKTGLKELFVEKKIKNLVDYMIGIEAGLDSNGRKNRGGHSMEAIVESFVKNLCNERGFRYIKEANAKKIQEELNISFPDVKSGKSSRRYDFIIDAGEELFILETNFYNGGGSKLKSTAGEYRNLFDTLGGDYKFIWITDGMGWKSSAIPLKETFKHNDYIFSLAMLENGILESIVC